MTTATSKPQATTEFATEIKFVVSPAVAEKIHAWTISRLAADPHGGGATKDAYQITSLYFDTDAFDTFYRRGSFGRSKYRIRRYGQNAIAFLERKLKNRDLLKKRRTIIKLDELGRLENAQSNHGWPGAWFHQRILARQLKPICEISYQRIARIATTDFGAARLTLDREIRALPTRALVFNGAHDGEPLSQDRVILEMKFHFQMPVVFKQLVEEFALNPQPISKYRLAAVALKLVPTPETMNRANNNNRERSSCQNS